MTDLRKLTKEGLIARCKGLQSENDRLQDELDRLSDCYSELENDYADLNCIVSDTNAIKDLDEFKLRLRLDGLLTSELEFFIEDYMKFHNERK